MKSIYLILGVAFAFLGCSKKESSSESAPSIQFSTEKSIYNNQQTQMAVTVTPSSVSVSKVDFYMDGIITKTLFSPPYQVVSTFNDLKTGTHIAGVSVTLSDSKVLTSENEFTFKVKLTDQYQGGIIIKISADSLTGTIASKFDLTGGLLGLYKYGAYSENYGANDPDDGLLNTNKFLGHTDFGYAAIACLNLEYEGYSDWYLPAINELLLFENFKPTLNIPERTGHTYWSSTGSDTYPKSAFSHSFGADLGQPCDMQNNYYVRPVRRF